MHYRLYIGWRFLEDIIEEYGWIPAIILVGVVVAFYDLFNGRIILDFIKPVTDRISRLIRKIDHSVKKYPDDKR